MRDTGDGNVATNEVDGGKKYTDKKAPEEKVEQLASKEKDEVFNQKFISSRMWPLL